MRRHEHLYLRKRTADAVGLREDMPADLAHPRDTGRASFIANVVLGGALLIVVLASLVYAGLAVQW